LHCFNQGCQMVCFQTKNPNLGKFWRIVDWKMLKYFMAIWNIFWTFGIFMTIWYILCSLGTLFLALVYCTKKIWQPCFQPSPCQSYTTNVHRNSLWITRSWVRLPTECEFLGALGNVHCYRVFLRTLISLLVKHFNWKKQYI
jgi:hypothetical protein